MNAIIERLNSAGSLFVNFSAAMLVQVSILIFILLVVDFLLRRKVRAVFRYYIWLLVLVKLVIPPTISSPLSIGGLFGDKLSEIKIEQTESPGDAEQAGQIVQVPRLAVTEPKPELYKEIDPTGTHLRSLEWQKEQAKVIEASMGEVEERQIPIAVSVSITWQGIVFLAWTIVLLILIMLLIQRAMFVRGLIAQADEITGGLNDLVQSCCKLLGMKGRVRLRTSPNATSPAVCGLFRPVILLPQNLAPSLTKEQLKAVLVHELIHIKRGDLWISLFQALLQIAYFYNPFVWLANAIIRRAREQAVDEAVQVAIGKSAESYPQILVDVAKLAFKKPALSLRLIGVVENKSALKDRIARMISRPIPQKAKLGLVGLISVFVVAAVLLPMAKAQKENATDETDIQKPQFKAELNNNVTVELVGMYKYPSKEGGFWRADGTILKDSYLEKVPPLPMPISDMTERLRIFLRHYGGIDTEIVKWKFDEIPVLFPGPGSYIRGPENDSAKWYEVLSSFPVQNEYNSSTLSFAIAQGQYKGKWSGYSVKTPNGTYVIGQPSKLSNKFVKNKTAITLSHNLIDVQYRLMAKDKNDKWHMGKLALRSVSGGLIQETHVFEEIEPEEVETPTLQTRHYQWVTFKNVSLKPNFKTDVKIEFETPVDSIKGQKPGESRNDRQENTDRIGAVTFKEGTPLRDAVRFIASRYKKNIILSDKVSGQVPITELYDVTFEELLEAVLGTHKYVVDDNFIRVYTTEEFESLYPNLKTDVRIESAKPQDRTKSAAMSGQVIVTQLPAEENDYELILTFNDDRIGGARWYDVTINIAPVEADRSEQFSIRIKAYIDGISSLVFKGNSVYWHNLRWAVPGRHGVNNYPTYINNIEWIPDWSGEEDVPRGERKSTVLQNLPFSLPRKPVNVQIETSAGQDEGRADFGIIGQQYSFGPVTQITINDNVSVGKDSLIDFDTGKLFSLPEDWFERNTDAMLKWIIENGIDAAGATRASVRGLMCEDMIIEVAPGGNSYWDNCQPDQLAKLDLWDIGKAGRPAYMTAQNKVPVTYIFKTREGGIGVLQITGFNDEPRGINIRYKMIQESAKLVEKSTGTITGRVLDSENKPVADAIVLICEKQTGIPLAEDDYLPFTNGYLQGQQKKPTFATTDAGGNFSFENLPQGKYRLIAQSWPGVKEVSDIFEVKSQIVNLNGIAENINVSAGGTEQVVIKSLGTGSLMINQDMPNDETFTVFSTSPTRADPILGFAGWTGDFLKNMLGGNRMPEGRTIVNGLPEGKIYIAMFAADSVPGWTEAQADIKANRTTGLPYVPFVNSWSNSRHDPPENLVPIFNEIRSLDSKQQIEFLMNTYKYVGLELSEEGGIWGFMAEIVDHLEKPVELPSGKKATFGEVMAAAQYIQLQKVVENKNKRIARQNEQSRQVQNSTQRSSQAETENNLQELIDSARAGQIVTVPRGIYTEPIVINKSLRLKGEDVNDCIIEVTADGPAVFVDTKGKGEVAIENLTIKWQLATSDRNIEYPFAAAVKDSRAQIKNCNFMPLGNYQRSPVALRAQGFTNMAVSDCRFDGYNYTVQYGEGTEGILQNSIITNSGHQGVINYSGSTLRVKGNIITGSKFHAVRSTGGRLFVEDNLLINNENRGIYLGNRSASGVITNNVIIGNGTNMSGFASSQVSIINNIIAGSSYAGISMRDSCRLSIANNIFLNNARGIILHEEAGKNSNRVSKNTFWENAVNFENIEQFVPPIEVEPSFIDPNNGDFSLKSGPVLEQKQGLKKPEVFKALWKKFKGLEPVKSDF